MSGRPKGPLFKIGLLGMVLAGVLGLAAISFGVYTMRPETETVASSEREPVFEPLTRSDNPGEAWKEEVNEPEAPPEPSTEGETPAPAVEPQPSPPEQPDEPVETAVSERPEPRPEQSVLPAVDEPDWPGADAHEIEEASNGRDYGAIPPGAILGLTIDRLGVTNAPVYGDDSNANLDRGVVHVPETSLPWSSTPERNTYLAAHRLGYPGTGSRMLFYNLDRLQNGDRISVKKRNGKTFTYEVSEMFVVSPYDSWVMGRVRDRDMLTLQTCTPVPTFEKRLIVRADRV